MGGKQLLQSMGCGGHHPTAPIPTRSELPTQLNLYRAFKVQR